MNKKNLFVFVLAGALASATLLLASFVSGKSLELLFSLSDSTVRAIPPLSALATAIFCGVGAYLRRKDQEDEV